MVMGLLGQLGFMLPSRSDTVSRQGIMDSARGFLVFVFLILLPEVAFGSGYYSSGRQMISVVAAPVIPPPSADPNPVTPPPSSSPPFPPPPFLQPPPPLVLQPPPPPFLQPPAPPFLQPPPPPFLQPPPPPVLQPLPPPFLQLPAPSPPVLPPPPAEFPPPPAVESSPPTTIVTPGDTWNESEKAGVVIASIAALLQVAVVAFLLVKRHQMLTTVEYGDIDDLEYDNPRDNPNFRHADSA